MIIDIPELNIKSFTFGTFEKTARFTLDNIYFKKTLQEKINTIYKITSGGNYICFDTETNGTNLIGDSLPFQFAAIKYRNHKEVSRILININIGKIPQEIIELTKVPQSIVDQGISPNEAFFKIYNFLKNEEFIIAHNADFDINILNNLMVFTENSIEHNIIVYDSMQFFYTTYRHFLDLGIGGSSLDFASKVLLNIKRDETKTHQADYDVEILQLLLDRIGIDIKNYYSIIENKVSDELARFDYLTKLLMYPTSNQTLGIMKKLSNEIIELFDYYTDLKYKSIYLQNALANYLANKNKNQFSELFLKDVYIKKTNPFKTVKWDYLSSYQGKAFKIITPRSGEINFFDEHSIFDTNIIINNDNELYKGIKNNNDMRTEMTKTQNLINKKLIFIKEFFKVSNIQTIDGLTIFNEYETKFNQRIPNKEIIVRDINKGIIKTKEDLYEYRGYNTNLTTSPLFFNIL